MSTLSRIPTAVLAALALAAAVAAPADAQDVRRPIPHPHGAGVPHGAAAPHAPVQAQQPRRGGNGAGVAAGVIGGLAAGALLGGILSNGAAAPGPAEGVEGPRPGCPLVRQPVYDGSGRFAGYQDVPSC